MNRLIGNGALCLFGAAILLNGPTLAIDLTGSVSAGAVSAGAGVSVGGGGVSAGAGVSVGGGGVSAGAGASVGGGGVSAGAGIDDGGGSISAGTGVSTDTGGAPTDGATSPAPRTTSSPGLLALPNDLLPITPCTSAANQRCEGRGPGEVVNTLAVQPNAPLEIVTACHDGIIQAALPYDPVRVDAVSAGDVQETEGGGHVAPLLVRIVYDRQGGYETREAPVTCHVDAAGAVYSLV